MQHQEDRKDVLKDASQGAAERAHNEALMERILLHPGPLDSASILSYAMNRRGSDQSDTQLEADRKQSAE